MMPQIGALLLALLAPAAALHAQSTYSRPYYTFTTLAGMAPSIGSNDGPGEAAQFSSPNGVAVDAGGNVFVTDSENHTIRRITPEGVVTTFAGLAGSAGFQDGTGSTARFVRPSAITVDSLGNLYVAGLGSVIKKITPLAEVTTFVGSGGLGVSDGTGTAAEFNYPAGLAVDGSDNVYVADHTNHTVRKITPAGVVTTFAGSPGNSGSADGTGNTARFYGPTSVAVGPDGNVYVTDSGNYTVRKITPEGVVTTLAGSPGNSGSNDGTGAAAQFSTLDGIAVDASGNAYVADVSNFTIRKITPAGVVTTLAGTARAGGSLDGTGPASRFLYPSALAVDTLGNVYVADLSNHSIRKVTPTGVVTTLAGRVGSIGSTDGPGASARFYRPYGVAVDGAGNTYVSDYGNSTIRKITAAGEVTLLAGMTDSPDYIDGTGSSARFGYPAAIAADNSGNLFVMDAGRVVVRKITPAGAVSSFAGSAGNVGSADGTGADAQFGGFCMGLAVDGSGNVYVADTNSHTIRKITAAGVVTTFAGVAGISGSTDGTGSAARFSSPTGIAVDNLNNVYVADYVSSIIRKITPEGVVTTLAGSAGNHGSSDGLGNAARFLGPNALAVDAGGNVYVVDSANHTIRKITPVGKVTTIAGLAPIAGAADGQAGAARFHYASGIAVDGLGNVYVADNNNHVIRKGTPAPRVPADFNGDGHPDILWQHAVTGHRYLWFMNGASTAGDVSLGVVPADWQIAAAADFNDDGHPDLLWQHAVTGQRYLWFMNGTTTIGDASLGTVPVDWRIAAAADFNGDGHPDIIWQHAVTGQRHLWYMNGASTTADASLGTVAVDWHMVAAADFNGDGHPDIIWEHAVTGLRYIWYMNNAAVIGDAPLTTIHADWHMVAAADFNGDGHPDILWEHAVTGLRYIWYMNGATVIGDAPLGTVPPDWHMVN